MLNKTINFARQLDLHFTARNFLLLTIGSAILAFTIVLFLVPANLAPGGVSGAAIIINYLFNWPLGLVMLALNLPMLALGFRYLGRFQFLIQTAYVVLLYNIGVDIISQLPLKIHLTDDTFLNALYGGIFGGIGTGLIYRGQGTSGGTSVLGRVIQMKTGIPISQVYLLTDTGVVLVAALVFGWEKALYAMITLFIWGLATDYVMEGPSVVRTVFVVTDRPDQVTNEVMDNLKIGITSWPGQGMYSEAGHTVLFCTVSRSDVNILRQVVVEADPRAFITIGHGHQVVGGVVGRALPSD
jgi:uncharacterized membrane-anchored protein YitT (DUF2179 family)